MSHLFGSQWYQRMPFRKSDGKAWWKLWKPSPCVKKREKPVVAGRVLRRVRPRAPHVREGVDEERRVVDEDDAQEAAPQEAAERPPEERTHEGRKAEADADADHAREAVLPHDARVALEVGHGVEIPVRALLVEDPEDVRPEKAALDVVRVAVRVDEAVVLAVVARPLEGRVLQGHRPEEEHDRLDRGVALVGAVREIAVVARADGEPDREEERQAKRRLPPLHAEARSVEDRPRDARDG